MAYHQGARVNSPIKVRAKLLLPEKTLDQIRYDTKREAYLMAQANRNKPWARRWLRMNAGSY